MNAFGASRFALGLMMLSFSSGTVFATGTSLASDSGNGNPTLNEQISEYVRGCVMMLDGIGEKNMEKLMESISIFDSIALEDYPEDSITDIISDSGEKPSLLFIPEYADKVLMSDFQILNPDDISLMRAESVGEVVVLHKGVKPHGDYKFSVPSVGHSEMAVVGDNGATPEVKVFDKANGKDVDVTVYPGDNRAVYSVWEMENSGDVEITIVNDSDSKATYVIAFN